MHLEKGTELHFSTFLWSISSDTVTKLLVISHNYYWQVHHPLQHRENVLHIPIRVWSKVLKVGRVLPGNLRHVVVTAVVRFSPFDDLTGESVSLDNPKVISNVSSPKQRSR